MMENVIYFLNDREGERGGEEGRRGGGEEGGEKPSTSIRIVLCKIVYFSF